MLYRHNGKENGSTQFTIIFPVGFWVSCTSVGSTGVSSVAVRRRVPTYLSAHALKCSHLAQLQPSL